MNWPLAAAGGSNMQLMLDTVKPGNGQNGGDDDRATDGAAAGSAWSFVRAA